MASRYLIGVDIGTTATKGILLDVAGNVLAYRGRDHATSTPRPGWCEQDGDEAWWGDVSTIIRGLVTESGVDPADIAGVAISALAPDLLPLDEEGKPLRPGMIYADTRAAAEIEELTGELGAEHVVELAGRPLPPDSVGAKLVWLRKHEPQVFGRMRWAHGASSYVIYRLTGQHVTDFFNAQGCSPFFNMGTMSWREDICRQFGVPVEALPPVKPSTDVAGEVHEEGASATGLAVGTPVIVGVPDAMAEFISTGAVQPGEASLLYGTTIVMGIIVPPAAVQSGLLAFPLGVPGVFMAGLGMSASGALTRWFRDNFGQAELDAQAKLGLNAYQLLAQEAESIPPGCEGLLVLPHFAGERSPHWDSLARGLILGLTLSHTRRHIYRALLEGTAYGLRQSLEPYIQAGVQMTRIVATGGGVRNRVWTQVVSDVTGYDQEALTEPWGAPYGDAYLAGMGVGLFPDLTALREVWKRETVHIQCNPETKALYDRYYAVYQGLYAKLKDDMHALAVLGTAVSP